MKFIIKKLSLILLLTLISQTGRAELQSVAPANDIPKQLNQFVDKLLILHKQLVKQTPHIEKHRTGGYSNLPDFYNEIQSFNQQTNTLTSIVQWERANPEVIHSIEVFLRDEQGRPVKDFSASYLAKHHNAPMQTLITLHYYNKDLHGFRVFDALGVRIFDICRGSFNGKKVNIDLDDDYGELSEALEDKNGIMSSDEYLACFGGRDVDKTRLNIPLK